MSPARTALVVGGGIIGVCSAYDLARAGWRVTLVEKDEIASGSSWGNAGLIVPSHSIPLAAPGVLTKGLRWMLDPESPFYVRPRVDRELVAWLWRFSRACTKTHVRRSMPVLRALSQASASLYRELATTGGFDFGYREDGVLMVFRTPHGYQEALQEVELLASAGIPARPLTADAARAVEPSLLPDVVGGVLFSEDAHLVPDLFVTGLARIAEQNGVQIRRATEVMGFLTEGRAVRAAETTKGTLDADEFVLAAGAWSPALGETLRLALPVQPAKGYSVTCRRPDEGPRIPLLLGEARAAVTPMGDTLRLAGTLELSGLDLSINRRRVAALMRSVRRYVRGADRPEVIETWRGLRPCTPDGLPIIGRAKAFDNLIVATGHAMIGVSLGPVTGRLVSQVASGERPLVDLAPLTPDRF